jgi:hypothetical protein
LGCTGNGGPATAAPIHNPHGIGFGLDGALYISEGECNAVRKIDMHGTLLPVLGTGTGWLRGSRWRFALTAEVSNPDENLTFDARGNLYVGVPRSARRS